MRRSPHKPADQNLLRTPGLFFLFSLTVALIAGCSGETDIPLQGEISAETLSELTQPTSTAGDSPVVSDWPQMFGPAGNSRSPENWIQVKWPASGPETVWEKEIGLGYSQPVISEGRLVLLHRIDEWELASCYDSETGQELWETVWPGSYDNPYDYSDGTYTTPIIGGDRVYLLGATAQLVCLSMEDGARLWHRDLEADYEPGELAFGFGATPLLEDDRLIINLGGTKEESGIVAIDKQSGDTLWTATEEIASYCTPVATTVGGQRYVLVLAQTNLVCLDPETGKVYWKEEFGVKHGAERVNAVSPLLVPDDRVLITSGPGPGARLIQLKPDGGHEIVWETRRGGLECQYTNVLRHDDVLFGFSPRTASELRCVDLKTGEQLWAWHRENTLRRSMAIQAGERLVIALGQEGHLFSMAPDRNGPQLISWVEEPVLEKDCFTQPVLSRGLLYVRNEQKLKCLSLRPEKLQLADSVAAGDPDASNR